MSDILMQLNANPATSWLAKSLGLPDPVQLEREAAGYSNKPFEGKQALIGTSPKGYALKAIQRILEDAGASICVDRLEEGQSKVNIVVMDATGLQSPSDYKRLYDVFHPIAKKVANNGRVLIIAPALGASGEPVFEATARGIEGFSRSLGKELGKKGITVNLAYCADKAVDRLEGPIRFFCGKQTTYVSGQVVHINATVQSKVKLDSWSEVLKGKVAVVTGSARGIGLATAERLAREGAQVVCLDVPSSEPHLTNACKAFGGTPLALDICTPGAAEKLASFLRTHFDGVDIVVHNAGITRDKTLGNMSEHFWELVVAINLQAIIDVDKKLIETSTLKENGRVVCLSSISGVAGNFGQTNYAATKAALIGYVAAMAPRLAERGVCINAIAPGFIQTAMTDAIPFVTREVGGRMNAISQPGKPVDAAELITFLSSPGAVGITGNTIRVCGQGLIGA